MRVSLVLLVLVAVPLAGCTAALDSKNFTLAPARIGWNVTEVATFDLTLRTTRGLDNPAYTIDPVFAVMSVKLDTGGVGGDYSTSRPEDLELRLLVDGKAVAEHRMTTAEPTVQVELRLPENLKDDAYQLHLTLFQAGTVKSEHFRVNRP